MNREQFLTLVRDFVAGDQEVAALIADHVQAGLRKSLSEARERAADMEVLVAVLTAKRYKNADKIVADTLAKWVGKTALNWSGILEAVK